MAEVHDVASPPRGRLRGADGGLDVLGPPEEDARVDVPLESLAAGAAARLVERELQSTETTSEDICAYESIRCAEPEAKWMTGTSPRFGSRERSRSVAGRAKRS